VAKSGEYEGKEYIHHMTMADTKIIAMTVLLKHNACNSYYRNELLLNGDYHKCITIMYGGY